MNTDQYDNINESLNNAIIAYQKGDRFSARKWSMQAILKNPGLDSAWILLAAVSPPEHAIKFLSRAISINPENVQARKGLHWAIQQNRMNFPSTNIKKSVVLPLNSSANNRSGFSWFNLIVRKLLSSILILLVIALITLLTLHLADLGKARIPIELNQVIKSVFQQFSQYLINHPATYVWKKEVISVSTLVGKLFLNSAGLLLLSLAIATIIGGLLGVFAARIRKRNLAPIMIFLSILGISLPSFLFAMLFWILDFRLYRWLSLSTAPFPPTGFGWDAHLVMPALVLAARPLAQIMQITYINTANALKEDFIRTATAKGLHRRTIISRHVYRNILIPVLTTLGTSLRFSLASLPVVESFFLWPGIGLSILQALDLNNSYLVTDLIVVLGLFFLLINYSLDFIYPIIDPRLRSNNSDINDLKSEKSFLNSIREFFSGIWFDFKAWVNLRRRKKPGLELKVPINENFSSKSKNANIISNAWKSDLKKTLTNIPLIFGTLSVLALLALVIFGKYFSDANPFQTNGMMIIEGVIQTPPFKPSSLFPWGSDLVGRDIQALVLSGASQTITLAIIATIARVLFGTFLGIISGWWSRSWIDRFIQGISSVWAAFPETIFTLLIILALGIQRGRSVFIIALCLVGWSEITQLIRSQVISQKPALYIEAANSIGSRARQILSRHVFPHLIPSILVLSVLQMGGILMLLAELGFLNIFLGGGFKAMIAETANMTPVIFYFSDIPEWGALLANIRDWWRSYPWLAWYPGVFFFFSIFAFNLWGEGLRRLIQETRINLNRLFNRYTVSALSVIALAFFFVLRSTSPLDTYKDQAELFNTNNAMHYIEELSSENFHGRRSGDSGGYLAANYIAEQMESIGIFPAASNTEYIQEYTNLFPNLYQIPRILVMSPEYSDLFNNLTYKKDYSEYSIYPPGFGSAEAETIGVALGEGSDPYEQKTYLDIDESLEDKIVIVREQDSNLIHFKRIAGLIIITDNDEQISKNILYTDPGYNFTRFPVIQVTKEVGEKLLRTCNSNLKKLGLLASVTAPNQLNITETGVRLYLDVTGTDGEENSKHWNVMGYIPGTGALQESSSGNGSADQQVIIISAYYDGLGYGLDRQFYPGANDNASGVATMLEIARVMKNAPYPPEKTVLFIAWAPGERQEGLSIVRITEATNLFNNSYFEAVLELSGVGAGSGNALSLEQGSSYRLVNLFKNAAQRTHVKITTRGRGPHAGLNIRQGFGERTALTTYISWDGSDQYAHTPLDTFDNIDPVKLKLSGQTTLLVTTVLSREPEY